MAGIRRVSDLGTRGIFNLADNSVISADIANNAVTQAKLDTSVPLSGFRNAIVNGDFRIWQRGTTVTPASGYGYTADRWQTYAYAASATTVTRTAFAAGTTLGNYQPQHHARINSTAAAMFFEQKIENVSTFAGQTITISFYARHQTATTVPIYIEQNFGTGGSTTVSVTGNTFSIGTSWQRYTYTVTMPSLSGKTIGTSSFVDMYIFSGAVNNYLDLWGFQVEQGSQVTPFEQRHLGTELALCQRYYELGSVTQLKQNNDTLRASYEIIYYKVTKRIQPHTVTGTNSGSNIGYCTAEGINDQYQRMRWNSTSGVDYVNTHSWTASAEL